jgi:hypothetical protein
MKAAKRLSDGTQSYITPGNSAVQYSEDTAYLLQANRLLLIPRSENRLLIMRTTG